MKIGPYTIQAAKPTGGKAGKVNNKTSTINIMKGQMIVKRFRYETNFRSAEKAERRAIAWCILNKDQLFPKWK